jgi:regulatory protein
MVAEYGTKRAVMRTRQPRRPRPPLNNQQLGELALFYVGRFATTRAKLRDYLARKVRERGWEEAQAPDFEGIAARYAALGYVDDRAFALAKSRSFSARGYGLRRLDQSLRQAGVEEEDGRDARSLAEEDALDAALRFAERRRLGPFAGAGADPRARERGLAAMIRAGHGFGLSRAIVDLDPDGDADRHAIAERIREKSY